MSFCAALFSFGFSTAFHLSPIFPFVFFTTLLVYTGQRYYKMYFADVCFDQDRTKWMTENKRWVEWILVLAFVGVLFFGIPLLLRSLFNLALILFCAAVSVFYVMRIGNKNLREVPGLKVFLVTIVYFLIVCVLPFQSLIQMSLSLQPLWIFTLFLVCQYLYIVGVTVLFDIPDIELDDKSLRTVAQMVGIRKTVILSAVLILPLIILAVFASYHSSNKQIYVWVLIVIHGLFYYFLTRKQDKRFYLSFVGEGILGILGVFYYLI